VTAAAWCGFALGPDCDGDLDPRAEADAGAAEYRLTVEPSSAELIDAVLGGLRQFNVERSGPDRGEQLIAVLRFGREEVVGGACGVLWGAVLEVMYLWLREDLRGQGRGRQLLLALEREAVARGCTIAFLSTFSFQAPEFYKKMDYEPFAEIEGFPDGVTQVYLRKSLL
jgi:GNAT superfamily N-acetyltransferase